MPAEIRIRPALPGDVADIARIYNQGIRARIATFETEERTPEERRTWLLGHDAHHPVLVATDTGERIVGWADASGYRSRACYAGVAEFSIYVDEVARGQGVGSVLLPGLIDAARDAGLWKLVSRIFVENAASRALCARCGFREVGIYEKHARLDGIWRDVVIVERLIPENQS